MHGRQRSGGKNGAKGRRRYGSSVTVPRPWSEVPSGAAESARWERTVATRLSAVAMLLRLSTGYLPDKKRWLIDLGQERIRAGAPTLSVTLAGRVFGGVYSWHLRVLRGGPAWTPFT